MLTASTSLVGWRARIGVVVPHLDHTSEPLFARLLPGGISFHVSRMRQAGQAVDQASLRAMNQELEHALDRLPLEFVDLVLYHCTSGSFVDGPETLAARIRERTGRPVTTTSLAVLAALRDLSVRSVILVTPYIDAVNAEEKQFLETNGIAVLAVGGEALQTSAARHHVAPEEIARWARKADHPDADAIFISCTALRAAECAAALEADLRKPVVTSNTATLWHVLRLLGVAEPILGCGRLLERAAATSLPSPVVP